MEEAKQEKEKFQATFDQRKLNEVFNLIRIVILEYVYQMEVQLKIQKKTLKPKKISKVKETIQSFKVLIGLIFSILKKVFGQKSQLGTTHQKSLNELQQILQDVESTFQNDQRSLDKSNMLSVSRSISRLEEASDSTRLMELLGECSKITQLRPELQSFEKQIQQMKKDLGEGTQNIPFINFAYQTMVQERVQDMNSRPTENIRQKESSLKQKQTQLIQQENQIILLENEVNLL